MNKNTSNRNEIVKSERKEFLARPEWLRQAIREGHHIAKNIKKEDAKGFVNQINTAMQNNDYDGAIDKSLQLLVLSECTSDTLLAFQQSKDKKYMFALLNSVLCTAFASKKRKKELDEINE